MICYLDRTFCSSNVEKHTCGCEFTKEHQEGAKRWWGDSEGEPPIAFSKFCEE